MLALMCESEDVNGQRRRRESDVGKPLAGKSTLNRMELRPEQDKHRRYRKIEADTAGLDALLVDVFLEAHEGDAPVEVVLDVDATGDPLHGEQEGRFFHGYYKSYCYLPLYIFCGHHLLCARLRTGGHRCGAWGGGGAGGDSWAHSGAVAWGGHRGARRQWVLSRRADAVV